MIGNNPSIFDTAVGGEDAKKLPVENVTWFEAVEFCNKLSEREGFTKVYTINGDDVAADFSKNGYRLPTEAEWEYACRAGTTGDYNGDIGDAAWDEANSYDRTHEVGKKAANAWKLHDMHGNVWEWCWDWYGAYDDAKPKGPEEGYNRVSRGGGWIYEEEYLRSSYRGVSTPDDSDGVLGFRIVRGK